MYINNLISEFKIDIFKVIKVFFLCGELLPSKSEVTEQICHLYLKKVEKVIFSIVVIRLNNAQAISKLIKFLVNPNLNYIKIIDYNICYLVLNKYLVIKYKAENKNSRLIAVTNKIYTIAANASYGNHLDRRLSKEHILSSLKV